MRRCERSPPSGREADGRTRPQILIRRFAEAEMSPLLASVEPIMSVLDKIKAVLNQLFPPNRPYRRPQEMPTDTENQTLKGRGASKGRNFNEDYDAANRLLRQKMNARFPDNYHAKPASRSNSVYDYGEDRAFAIDTASSAIAAALRAGATVQQAADAGAASVGL